MIFIIRAADKFSTTHRFAILLTSLIIHLNCAKLIEVNTPKTSIDAKNVYTNDVTASAVLTGIYTTLSASNITGTDLSAIGLTTGLSGDELVLYGGSGDIRLRAYYQNNLKTITSYNDFWSTIYKEIYILNLSLEGLTSSTTLTPSIKQQLLGEVKFMRALCYFYLVNLYGDVPLVLSTDYTINNILHRNSKEVIWTQIISDLKEAKSLLSSDYLDGTLLNKTTERVRPTKWSAAALLARSYLYIKDWKNAEVQSTEIINNSIEFNLDSLNRTFLLNSHEAIWQLQPVNIGSNTEDAKIYILTTAGPTVDKPVFLSPQLLNSFEINDQRKKIWIDTVTSSGILYHYAHKYKSGTLDAPLTEYNCVFRLGEQYLIRAEARAQQNNIKDSRNDLNSIRMRAGLNGSTINEKEPLLDAIYRERQVELFTEWGHRWFDIKRTEKVNTIMANVTPSKGGSWSSNWQLLPVPSYDILVNGNLTQNAGY
ncbi:RagB/SusD family nutrient uptake outer membrane protein [Chitinophaga sp. CC14]|uniref:RagB/SusD family nutrient uptake outer membrane protein n=1 Tax=Chitinophaga sp. CC14 TaxID=3029199 RepID=UPI003B82BEC1